MSEKRSLSDESSDSMIGMTLFNKFKIIQKIGQGSFGKIYIAQSICSQKLYAVKLESIKDSYFLLEDESLFLSYINSPRIPKVKLFGYSGPNIVLVMELLGPSLDRIIHSLPDKKMSLRCVCNIAYQMISIFETIHNYDIVHRDVKPGNIAIGVGEGHKFLYLIDFGLSIKFRSFSTKKYFPFEQGKKLVGNARYSSINALEGGTQSPRDDLESLGYVLIYFCLGKLPWQGMISHSKEDKYYKIREIKKTITPAELCENLPPQFVEYIKYTRNLKYEETPDYNYLKNLFITILKNNNWEFDYYYDWDQTTLKNGDINSVNNSSSTRIYSQKENHKLFSKIKELKKERKLYSDDFDVERFVFDIEEESNYNIMRRKQNTNNEEEMEKEYNNYSNSMQPYSSYKIRRKVNGCLPCQPKGYKEEDEKCCMIF